MSFPKFSVKSAKPRIPISTEESFDCILLSEHNSVLVDFMSALLTAKRNVFLSNSVSQHSDLRSAHGRTDCIYVYDTLIFLHLLVCQFPTFASSSSESNNLNSSYTCRIFPQCITSKKHGMTRLA